MADGAGADDFSAFDDEEGRYWTVEAARAYLPRLRQLLTILRRAESIAAHARTNGHGKVPGLFRSDQDEAGGDLAADEVEPPPGIDPEAALAEIEDLGIVLRDPARGLVDFPALHPSGVEVLLCWRAGEEDLGWWHLPEDGFAGRRRLPWPREL